VKGALTSRNSFIGITNKSGTYRIGKTDAPYKTATARMNPFSGELGDYSVIMGNTGGDNRVEFGTRFDHAIWYQSPRMGPWTFSFLAAPGQNRSFDDGNIAAGESSCAGGNVPGSGALTRSATTVPSAPPGARLWSTTTVRSTSPARTSCTRRSTAPAIWPTSIPTTSSTKAHGRSAVSSAWPERRRSTRSTRT